MGAGAEGALILLSSPMEMTLPCEISMPKLGTQLRGLPGQVETLHRTRRGQLHSHGCVLLFQASPSPIIVNTDTLEPSLSVSLPPLLESLPPPEGLAHFQEAALLGCPLGGLRCLEPKVGGGIDHRERSLLQWACRFLERVTQRGSLGKTPVGWVPCSVPTCLNNLPFSARPEGLASSP